MNSLKDRREVMTGRGIPVTSWGTSGFSNWDIDELSNAGKWPFIISVACVNGNFVGATCFAEAWTRAEKEGEPTGAVATLMSTINQSWNPPMRGQDEMNSILSEAYEENIKRTFGGITMNGCMNMNDVYGQGGFTETDCWTIFGDPSVVVRTAIPAAMEVSHTPAITLGETSFTVACNAEGALATLSLDGEILGSAVVSSGSATIEFDPVSVTGIADIVITAFNYRPYISTVELIPADGPYLIVSSVTVSDEAANGNGLLDYAESGIFLTIGLTNIGTETANGVEASLAGDLVYIEMDGSVADYGDILPEDTVYITDAFVLSVADSVPDMFELLFSFSVSDTDENQWESTFHLTAHSPDLLVSGYTIHDQDGNDNQKLDPGETAEISIAMTNAGSSEAYEVVSQLSSMSDYVNIFSEEQFSGNLDAGATATVSFTLAAAADTPEGHLADLLLEMAAEHNISGSGDLSLLIGKKPLLVINLTNEGRTSDSLALCLDMLQVNADFT
ncbi:MAG: C25 family peptidase C-terminal domain-containing protein, partial [bacterium]